MAHSAADRSGVPDFKLRWARPRIEVKVSSRPGLMPWLALLMLIAFVLGFAGPTSLDSSRPIHAAFASYDYNQGYAMVGSDGGVYNFGSQGFHGSEGGQSLNAPMVGMASTPQGLGYWLVGSDGGIFSFGNAAFYGSIRAPF